MASSFWSESFWLPSNVTWRNLTNTDSSIYKPQLEDIQWSLPLGVVLLIIRFIYERLVVIPIGRWLGIKEQTASPPVPNPALEKYYKQYGVPDNNNVESVSKQTDLTVREVERWFRQRKKQDVIPMMKKFTECSWHFTFYLLAFWGGLAVLWKKPWFESTTLCWEKWPNIHVSNDVYWYYLIELAFYWCLVFTLVHDHKRKDFNQMIVHHVVTLMLMYFSWTLNFVRIGTLVLMVHDAADYWMAAAKMAKYCKKTALCEVFFITFFIVWILSRLMYYPIRVLYCSAVEVYDHIEPFMSYHLFNGLLFILQAMHIVWTYMILGIALQKLKHGELKQDVRSEPETDSD